MKMRRLALVLPAFVLLLAAAGAARAATFFARLEKDPLLRRQRPATKPNAALLVHEVLLQHSPQTLQSRLLSPTENEQRHQQHASAAQSNPQVSTEAGELQLRPDS